MYGSMRKHLAGACLVLLMGVDAASAQIESGTQHIQQATPAINLGLAKTSVVEPDLTMRAAVVPNAGKSGKVTVRRGETAIRYSSADLPDAANTGRGRAESEKGTLRAIMVPASAEESQQARASRVFPSNLNEGTSLDVSATAGGLLKAAGITGDTNARGPASIAELARSLRNDPDLIYQYVRNNIEYYPFFGVQKGALGAVLDNQGTDHDQAMLLVELLHASGYEANYVSGAITLDATQAGSWFGIDTSNACGFYSVLAEGQIPVYDFVSSKAGDCPGLSASMLTVTIEHVWVKAKINGAWYVFDPSMKTHTIKYGVDLASSETTGYNAGSYRFSAQAGATFSTGAVQNINRTNIRDNLAIYAGNLANYLRKNKPAATLDDVIGGKSIDQFYGQLRQTALPYQDLGWPSVEFADMPNNRKVTLRVQYQGIDQSFTSDAVYGRRLTITYNAASQPVLKLDGNPVGQPGKTAPAGSQTSITFTVKHNAYVSPSSDQTFSQNIRAGGTNTYAIADGWGPAGRGPAENYRRVISDLRASGAVDTSEPLLGSTLALMGAQWIAQSDQAGHVMGQIANATLIAQHRIGVVGYVNNAYVDLPGNMISMTSANGDAATERATFINWAMHASILESAAVQQTTSISAVSTVKLIDMAAAAGQRIYSATSLNFNGVVQPNLVNCSSQIAGLKAQLAEGYGVITPARCDITENNWSGAGYFAVGPYHFDAIISDGLSGGFSTKLQPAAQTNINVNSNQQLPSSLAGSAFQYGDPIDMVQGNFLYDHDDIDAGLGGYPQDLSFKRLYSSGKRYSNGALGKGWTHNFNATVTTGSDGFQAMGENSALDAVGTLVEQKVSLDLMMDPALPLDKMVIATIGQRWFGDQLIDNTVIVTQGTSGEVFVKLPDGTYNPPPGKSAKLTRNTDGTYSYESLNRAVLKFNAGGKADTYTDPSGVQIKYTYSAAGDLTQVVNSLGRALTFTYSNGRIAQVKNGMATIGYGYDVSGNLITITDALGKNTTFSYSVPGSISSVYYPSFPTVAAVTNIYDTLGRISRQTNARGKAYDYYFAGSRTEEMSPGGLTRTNYLDGQGNILQSITPSLNVTVNTYDGQSRLIRSQLPEGNALEYSYDDATCAGAEKRCTHNVKTRSKVAPAGSGIAPITQSFSYESAFNRMESATDAIGNATRYSYTAQGLPLSVTSPPDSAGVSPVTSYSYTSYSPPDFPSFYLPTSVAIKTSATNAVTTTTAYDANNHFPPATSTVDAGPGKLNLTTSFTYDALGNLLKVTSPSLNTNTFAYDAARRVVQAADPTGMKTVTSYDADGRQIETAKQISRAGTQWMASCFRYSVTGKVIRAWGPGTTASATACPAEAAPVSVTDTNYDDLDRVSIVAQRLPAAEGGDRTTETFYYADDTVQAVNRGVGTALAQVYANYVYTPNGNLSAATDANGNVTFYTYDSFDRPSRIYYPHPILSGYFNLNDYLENTYDANGNVTTLRKRNTQQVTQTWDKLNRLVARAYPQGTGNVQFTYDLRGLRTAAQYASGAHSNVYTWDNAGRLRSAVLDGRTLSYLYDPDGNRTRLTWPDGFFVTTEYDSRNYPLATKENGSASLAAYGYDPLGRRFGMDWYNGSETLFQYDTQGRMSGLSRNFYGADTEQAIYSRNQLGEVTGVNWDNNLNQWTGAVRGSRGFTANGLNQYKSIPSGTPAYDANGNLTRDGTASYTYDLDNRLRSGTRAGVTTTLEYDPEGRLQQIVTGGAATNLLYDGNDLIAEYDGAGKLQKRYVHTPGTTELILSYDGPGTTTKNYFYADYLGSITATADRNGIRTGGFNYGPYGEPGAAPQRFGFTGQEYIGEQDLYYYKARMYSPTLGRFLQTDPAGPKDDLNLYAYVGNNPVNRVDPTGLAKVAVGVAIQVAGVVTDPSHYIKRVGAGNIDSVVSVAVGIAQSPGFVGGTSFGMTVNGVNYNVRSFVLPMGDINLGTIHPDDGRHR
ncbi:RHS repeat-associated core domain-containing protein [Caballeronia sp. LjRoot31]|jgi:RHS repeat-associated protein|uniref:RHS repeat-associated core domain-containing protein n=1 Tax=Caballeronia sp. LjRoot31 TaxID=3342324 RepID=UPI003ECC96FC